MKLVIRLKSGDSKIFVLQETAILVRDGAIEIAFAGGFAAYNIATQARSQEPAKDIAVETLITMNDVVTLYEI